MHRMDDMNYFTTLPNEIVKNKALSLKARGMLLLAFSNSDEWRTSGEWFEGQAPEGRDAIRSGMQELERFGYVRIEVSKGNGGVPERVVHWHMRPVAEVERTNVTKWRSGDAGFPAAGFPQHGKGVSNQEKVLNQEQGNQKQTPAEGSLFKLEDKKPEKKQSPQNLFTEQWSVRYKHVFKTEYKHGGGSDGSAVKKAITSFSEANDALQVASQAWERALLMGDRFCQSKRAATIRGFFAAYNDIKLELRNAPRIPGVYDLPDND